MNFLKGVTAKGLLVPYEDYKPLFVTKKSILYRTGKYPGDY